MSSRIKSFMQEPTIKPTGYASEVRSDELTSHSWKRSHAREWCVYKDKDVQDFVVTVVDDTHQKLELEAKFVRLRDKWQSETSHISATSKRVLHSAYQSIIGMGQPAIPLILRELERNVDSWFWALAAITEDDPATSESMGNGELLADAWIAWGKQKGYVW